MTFEEYNQYRMLRTKLSANLSGYAATLRSVDPSYLEAHFELGHLELFDNFVKATWISYCKGDARSGDIMVPLDEFFDASQWADGIKSRLDAKKKANAEARARTELACHERKIADAKKVLEEAGLL